MGPSQFELFFWWGVYHTIIQMRNPQDSIGNYVGLGIMWVQHICAFVCIRALCIALIFELGFLGMLCHGHIGAIMANACSLFRPLFWA